ncbi:MAG: hypothetical protein RR485_06725, partial [Mucinivorans sp.]
SSATLQKFLTLDNLNATFFITLISRYLGLRAPTPRSVPRHGNFLLDPAISVSPRDRPKPAGAQRLLIAGSNKKSVIY